MNFVTARISRLTYGIRYRTEYLPDDAEHAKRSQHVVVDLDGQEMISDLFQVFIPKVSASVILGFHHTSAADIRLGQEAGGKRRI